MRLCVVIAFLFAAGALVAHAAARRASTQGAHIWHVVALGGFGR